MSEIQPNLNLSGKYLRENVTRWGVSPEQCKRYVREDGHTFYLYIDRSSDLDDNLVSRNIRGRNIKEEPNGMYTWIYFIDKKGKAKFESSRIISPSELGTKHINLLLRADPYLKTLLLSGELEKQDDNYVVNFYSGSTNMVELPEQDRIGPEFVAKLKRILQLPKHVSVQYSSEPLYIEGIVSDRETLLCYERLGYQLLFFSTCESCKAYKSHIIRVFSIHRNLEMYQKSLIQAQQKGNVTLADKYTALIKTLEQRLADVPVPVANGLQELDRLT